MNDTVSIAALRDRARALEPVLRIGKNGLTGSVITEIRKQLKDKKLIKLKLLKPFLEGKDKKTVGREIAEKTGAMVVQQVGFVVVLFWKGNTKKQKNNYS